jgi:hypothetical protein
MVEIEMEMDDGLQYLLKRFPTEEKCNSRYKSEEATIIWRKGVAQGQRLVKQDMDSLKIWDIP